MKAILVIAGLAGYFIANKMINKDLKKYESALLYNELKEGKITTEEFWKEVNK